MSTIAENDYDTLQLFNNHNFFPLSIIRSITYKDHWPLMLGLVEFSTGNLMLGLVEFSTGNGH